MARRKPPPPIFHVTIERESDFRELADQTGVPYRVSKVKGRAGTVVEFRFQSMEDRVLFDLIDKAPADAWASKAIVGGAPPGVIS